MKNYKNYYRTRKLTHEYLIPFLIGHQRMQTDHEKTPQENFKIFQCSQGSKEKQRPMQWHPEHFEGKKSAFFCHGYDQEEKNFRSHHLEECCHDWGLDFEWDGFFGQYSRKLDPNSFRWAQAKSSKESG